MHRSQACAGAALFRDLVGKADVVVENFRPRVKTALGLDHERLKLVNPRIIVASISGFGQDGPYRDRPGVDQIIQGMSGLMSQIRNSQIPARGSATRHA